MLTPTMAHERMMEKTMKKIGWSNENENREKRTQDQ
jgi:hypothetical protein